jgi:hypothetical protein
VRAARLARVFDGRDAQGQPVLGRDRPLLVGAERELVVGFLDDGVVLLAGGPLVADEIDPRHPRVVPVGYATDGTWIWSALLRYYVAAHGISPEPAFLAHIRASGYRAGVPSKQAIERAGAELDEHFRRAAELEP